MTLILGFLVVGILAGCADAGQGVNTVGQRVQDGLQGKGQIVPNNPTNDSFGSDYR